LKGKLVPSLSLFFALAVMGGIFYLYQNYPDKVSQLQEYGYLGTFLISLTLNATLILPAGNVVIMAILGASLPSATLVGLAGGAGAALGEIIGYMAGYGGQAMVRQEKRYARLEGWVRKWGVVTIFLLSMAPLFFDLVGIAAGVLRFPFWKFLIACWLGRTILYIFVALAGAWGWQTILNFFS